MPTETDPQTDGTSTEPQTLEEVRAAWRREQKRRKEAEAAVAEAAQAKRDLAFVRAGVDLDAPIGKLFAKAYDGELDVDAIKSAYGEVATTAPTQAPAPTEPPPEPTPPTDEGMTPEQLAALAASRGGLTSNATPPGSEPQAPVFQAAMDAAFAAQGGVRARPTGGMAPKARDAAFNVIFEAAKQGNPDAVFKRPDETWADATERWRQSQ